MKYAIIIDAALVAPIVPLETPSATVLASSSGHTDLDATVLAFNTIADANSFTGTVVGQIQSVRLRVVRVEDSVVVGDLLDISGDIFHKHV